MTKRYYYTEPLAAAWMAKHFGMKFFYPHPYGMEEEISGNMNSIFEVEIDGGISERYSRYYIHPDSLHLLEPQAGDLMTDGESHEGDSLPLEKWADRYGIVQRNGIAFHWPESEEV